MGVSGAFLDLAIHYLPQIRAGSVNSLNPRGAVRSTIELQKICPEQIQLFDLGGIR
jgi:hypothetical protein